MTSVYYAAKEPISCQSDIFSDVSYNQASLYVPQEAVEKCKEISPWKNFKSIKEYDFSGIDEAIIDFDEDAQYEVYNISGVKVGDSIKALAPGLYIIRQGNKIKKIIMQ